MNKLEKPAAYSGKYIEYNKQTYFLIPERSQLGCNGCSFLGKHCTSTLTDYCRQGYIFKKVVS